MIFLELWGAGKVQAVSTRHLLAPALTVVPIILTHLLVPSVIIIAIVIYSFMQEECNCQDSVAFVKEHQEHQERQILGA